jgi:hypothetical protein
MNKIVDWKREYVQTALLTLIIVANVCFNLPEIAKNVLADASVQMSELDPKWRLAIGFGRWVFAIVVVVGLWFVIKYFNKDYVLKQNISNDIVWHTYFDYWFCRYFLSIKKLSLTRMPIPMQFKLVWKDLFLEYDYMDGITEKEEAKDKVKVERFQDNPLTSTVNLVLADTYPLDWKSKLPASVLNLTTIVIDRTGEKGTRYYSRDFVKKISSTVHDLPNNVTTINLFATINAAHCYHITKEVFMTGGRDSLKHLVVYEQSKGSWVFEGKNIKVF